MKIIIKVLNAEPIEIEVTEQQSILELKMQLERLNAFPIAHQKILLVGKTLADDKIIGQTNIKEGSKLTLVIKKPDQLKDVLQRNLKKYYSEDDSATLSKAFFVDFEKKLLQLSLDDLERLASGIINPVTQKQKVT
jgi:ubiquitin-like protein 4